MHIQKPHNTYHGHPPAGKLSFDLAHTLLHRKLRNPTLLPLTPKPNTTRTAESLGKGKRTIVGYEKDIWLQKRRIHSLRYRVVHLASYSTVILSQPPVNTRPSSPPPPPELTHDTLCTSSNTGLLLFEKVHDNINSDSCICISPTVHCEIHPSCLMLPAVPNYTLGA
jgi:hypothetical protein